MESTQVEGSRKRKHCDEEIKSTKKPKLEETSTDVDTNNSAKQKEMRSLNVISKCVLDAPMIDRNRFISLKIKISVLIFL